MAYWYVLPTKKLLLLAAKLDYSVFTKLLISHTTWFSFLRNSAETLWQGFSNILLVSITLQCIIIFILDSHHKLSRWKFFTRGGIDGYSRLIVYLKCFSGVKSILVYQSFLEATRKYHLPSRVRSDQGGWGKCTCSPTYD